MSFWKLPLRYQVAAVITVLHTGAWASIALAADFPEVAVVSRGQITALDLHVDIVHPSPGDLRLVLHYDSDRDGAIDAAAPLPFHLAHHEGGTLPVRWSVPATLDGAYTFHFGQVEEGLDEEDRLVLSRFVGMPPSGEFYLEAVDSNGSAIGLIRDWTVEVHAIAHGSALAAK